jgi:hypothetical protein
VKVTEMGEVVGLNGEFVQIVQLGANHLRGSRATRAKNHVKKLTV